MDRDPSESSVWPTRKLVARSRAVARGRRESKGGPVDHDACGEIAGFFRAEIERIIQDSEPYQPDG